MTDFSHAVIGGGVVGLAIGARLARHYGPRVVVLEKNALAGQETSSRNSEVIHAGLYYPPRSLRTKLCIRGKELTYALAKKRNLSVQNCGKWIVAQNDDEVSYLHKIHDHAKQTGVPLHWLSPEKGKELEPAVKVGKQILVSPTTGIMSAHEFMNYHEARLQAFEGNFIPNTTVVDIQKESSGYAIECTTPEGRTRVTADVVINSAGLYAPMISNLLLPPKRHVNAYYAKGSYYSYPLSTPKVSRLIYPCPSTVASLGTHLTIDLTGRLRFGPDLEWVNSPNDFTASAHNLEAAKLEVAKYIDLDVNELVPDYAGIRPKITDSGFQDFVIRQEEDFPGFINLLNIESPGLTASMAIAEYVNDLVG